MPELINPMWKCEGLDMWAYIVVRDDRLVILGRIFKLALSDKWHCSLNRSASSKSEHVEKGNVEEAKKYIEDLVRSKE